MKKYCLLPGRFQCLPPHEGHLGLARLLLSEGKNVCFALRRADGSDSNPFDFETRKAAIIKCFPDEVASERVTVVEIPDIEAICYGRGVGWEIREIRLDEKTESISGTAVRASSKPNG